MFQMVDPRNSHSQHGRKPQARFFSSVLFLHDRLKHVLPAREIGAQQEVIAMKTILIKLSDIL